jgi:acyl-CoA thioesterase
MTLHDAAALVPDGAHFAASFPDSWLQGRSIFGGLQLAALTNAMDARVDPGRFLREIHVRFVAPVAAGPAAVQATSLRHGKAYTQLEARLMQGGAPACFAWASYAAPRDSVLVQAPPARPDARPPEDCTPLPFLPGITPTFTQHLEYRWERGPFPFSGARQGGFAGWCRFKAPTSHAATPLALMDAWPPPASPLSRGPSPASSVAWTAYLAPLSTFDPTGWWFFQVELVESSGGSATHTARIWAPDGSFTGHESQLVAMYA